jgi:hypothetical protein
LNSTFQAIGLHKKSNASSANQRACYNWAMGFYLKEATKSRYCSQPTPVGKTRWERRPLHVSSHRGGRVGRRWETAVPAQANETQALCLILYL